MSSTLRRSGAGGSFAIALGPRRYAGLMRALRPGRCSICQRVRRLVDDRVVRVSAVEGAVVLSVAGGDFELSVGQDLSIGCVGHDDSVVGLALIASLTFRVLRPEAAVPLSSAAAGS